MNLSPEVRKLCLDESKGFFLTKSKERIKMLGECFTPTELVLEIIEHLPAEMFEEGRTFLDPSCGNGQFLAAVAIIKRELGHNRILETIYGVDIMEDNVNECRERLLNIVGHTSQHQATVEKNVVCTDGLEYDYSFNGTNLSAKDAVFNNLFEQETS